MTNPILILLCAVVVGCGNAHAQATDYTAEIAWLDSMRAVHGCGGVSFMNVDMAWILHRHAENGGTVPISTVIYFLDAFMRMEEGRGIDSTEVVQWIDTLPATLQSGKEYVLPLPDSSRCRWFYSEYTVGRGEVGSIGWRFRQSGDMEPDTIWWPKTVKDSIWYCGEGGDD